MTDANSCNMFKRPGFCISVIVWAAFHSPCSAIENEKTLELHDDKLLRAETRDFIQNKIRLLEEHDLREQYASGSIDVKLSITLEILRRSLATKDREDRDAVRIRSLGKLEGILGVDLPQWWNEFFLSVETTKSGVMKGGGHVYHQTHHQKGSKTVYVTRGYEFNLKAEGPELSDESGTKLHLPDAITETGLRIGKELYKYNHISAKSVKDAHFVSFFSPSDRSFPIMAVSAMGNVIWTSKCHVGLSEDVLLHGPVLHTTEIVSTDSLIVLFGVMNGKFYINAFDRVTGKPRAYVSSRMWEQ